MLTSLFILLFFVAGVVAGLFGLIPERFAGNGFSELVLYALLFMVGIGMGGNAKAMEILRRINVKIVLVPAAVIAGTLGGTALFYLFTRDITLRESLAVGSGFGWYSLSSVVITQLRGEALGATALLSNIFREITTLLLTPFLVRYFGRLAPIASGGATAMDTTLPVIVRFTGMEYGMISVFSGIVLTLSVPVIIPLILP